MHEKLMNNCSKRSVKIYKTKVEDVAFLFTPNSAKHIFQFKVIDIQFKFKIICSK